MIKRALLLLVFLLLLTPQVASACEDHESEGGSLAYLFFGVSASVAGAGLGVLGFSRYQKRRIREAIEDRETQKPA